MIEIVGKHRFVAAWFPVSRLYRLQVGDAITISTGGESLPGKIAEISVIADALPKEFQKAFAPAERQQLMWIEFDPGAVFAALLHESDDQLRRQTRQLSCSLNPLRPVPVFGTMLGSRNTIETIFVFDETKFCRRL